MIDVNEKLLRCLARSYKALKPYAVRDRKPDEEAWGCMTEIMYCIELLSNEEKND